MSARWTSEDLKAYEARRGVRIEIVDDPKPSKYRNRKTEVDGIVFDSKREANRYAELKLCASAGSIKDLQTQVRYSLEINGVKICDYIADFVYLDKFSRPGAEPWEQIVEDAKGCRTAVYKLKKKLMRAILGIEIRET